VQVAAAGDCTVPVTWTEPTAADNCGIGSLTSTHAPGDSFSSGFTTVTYTAVDIHGNTTTSSFTVLVDDLVGPVFTFVPADISQSNDLGDCSAVVTWTEATAADACATHTMASTHNPGDTFPVGTTTVTYTATDPAGNSTDASFDITVTDDEAPIISNMPADFSVPADAGACTTSVTWTPPTVTDNCGVATLIGSITQGALLPVGDHPITYFSNDPAGNITTETFVVTVLDVEAPVISNMPADMTLSASSSSCSAVATWAAPTVSDLCTATTLVSTSPSGASFPLGTSTVTYTATDAYGNSASASFNITVIDDTGPSIVGVPSNMNLGTDAGVCSATAIWSQPTAFDACSAPSLSASHASGDSFPLGSTTVTFTATDAAGNVSSASFTITVSDDEAPAISGLPASMTTGVDAGLCGAAVSWSAPSASDNCNVASFTSTSAPGDSFPVGTTTVTYTATDDAGNSTSGSFDVTVVDDEFPTIPGMPGNITQTADAGSCGAFVFWAHPGAEDNCGLSNGIVLDQNGGSVSVGDFFPVGTTTVSYILTDTSNNVTTETFTITITDDEDPTISGMPANITASNDAGLCGASISWTAPTAGDNCGGSISLTSSHASGSFFAVGTTSVTYTATDDAGNSSSASFTITVTDDEDPTLSGLPSGLTVNTSSGACTGTASWAAPSGGDNCGIAGISTSHAPGSSFALGTTTVTYTATDIHGNTASASFDVTVIDDEAPSISGLPGVLTFPAEPGLCSGIGTWSMPTASDNCGVASLTSTHMSGDSFPVGSTEVTYTATDNSGNTATDMLTIVIIDSEAPVISAVPVDFTVSTDAGSCSAAVSWTPPTASDNCSVSSLTSSYAPGDTFPLGITNILYTATDPYGNSSTAVFHVNVVDTEAPTITPGADISVDPPAGECTATITVPTPTTGDNCTVASVTNDYNGMPDASGDYMYGTTVITWTVTDAAGNSTTATQTIIVGTGSMVDCDGNGVADDCDVLLGNVPDCNENGIPDSCDIDSGVATDGNLNGILDECELPFIRADANADLIVNVADPVYLLASLFTGGPMPICMDAADANDDGFLDVSDVVFTLGYIFSGGSAPPAPFPNCDLDATPHDPLSCDDSACP
jgi:hypothetical protein